MIGLTTFNRAHVLYAAVSAGQVLKKNVYNHRSGQQVPVVPCQLNASLVHIVLQFDLEFSRSPFRGSADFALQTAVGGVPWYQLLVF